jgi:hypothetical protein
MLLKAFQYFFSVKHWILSFSTYNPIYNAKPQNKKNIWKKKHLFATFKYVDWMKWKYSWKKPKGI